jgi:subtilisin family serine protease
MNKNARRLLTFFYTMITLGQGTKNRPKGIVMIGKRKWFLMFLLLVCGLTLTLTLISAQDKKNSFSKDNERLLSRQVVLKQKMPVFLKQLSDLYQTLGVKKLLEAIPRQGTLKTLAAKSPENQGRYLFFKKMLSEKNLPANGKKPQLSGGNRKGLDLLLDPVLQQRWDNPPFDVGRGIIETVGNPRSLESPYLKIRKAWQKSGAWKAFCEFAIFKAEEIVTQARVVYLSLSPRAELNNNLGSISTGAPRLRLGQPGHWRNLGYTGNGVIVGDVDTGVDWAHGDFLDENGKSRILYLWDTEVDTPGKDPETLFGMIGFAYGTVWTKADIDNGLCTEFDGLASELPPDGPGYSGHGTHTLGTAAGNGGATGNYTGMAPNAGIIFVKGLDEMGVEFIFEMAHRLGRPAAVNNSWGISWKQYGPFNGLVYLFPGDGSDYYSQYMDYLNGEYPTGSIIVKSAGNDGMWKTYIDHDDYGFALYDGSLHFGGTSTAASPIDHVYHRIDHSFGFGMRREYSDMMIRSAVPVSVQVTFAGGSPVFTVNTGNSGEIPGAAALGYGTTWYDLDQGQDPFNGEYMGVIWFDAEPDWGLTDFFPKGNWTINVTPLSGSGTVNYDVWLYSQRSWYNPPDVYSFYDSCFTANSSYDEYQLDWSASPNAITVGAWTTRSEWLGADGFMHYPWGFMEPRLNTITYFSSPGPSRDGRMKPDIAAPGAVIISTLASNISASLPNSEKDPDLQHQWMWGTSMAAPHTTGACALILQKFPTANLNRVKGMLNSWARNDSNTRAIGPNGFGAGKLNVLPLNNPPVAVIAVDKSELLLDKSEIATFNGSGSYDPEKFPLTYTWSLVAKPAGAACTLTPSGKTAVLVPDPNLEGTYQVGLVVNDGISNSTMAVAAVVAKFYQVLPPTNFQLQRLENNFIFYKEYVNKLTWQANPENKSIITNYKLYKKVKGADDSSYALVCSFPPTTLIYEEKGLSKDQLFTYKLTSVNSRGKESDPVVVSN